MLNDGPTVENNDDLFGSSTPVEETTEQEPGAETPSDVEATEATETATDDQPEPGTETTEASVEAPAEANVEVLKILAKKGISEERFGELLKRYGASIPEVNANPKWLYLLMDKAAADEKLAKPATETKQDPPAEITDMAKHFTDVVMKEASEYNDPKALAYVAEQLQAAAEKGDVAGQVNILSAAMHNYIKTALPKMLPGLLTNFQTTQQREISERVAAHESAWATELGKAPTLPKDAEAAYKDALAKEPELVNNEALSPQQRMRMVALVLGGRTQDATKLAEVAEKGKKQGAEAERKAQLGKLGAGTSKGAMTNAKPRGNDDIFGGLNENPINQRLIGK